MSASAARLRVRLDERSAGSRASARSTGSGCPCSSAASCAACRPCSVPHMIADTTPSGTFGSRTRGRWCSRSRSSRVVCLGLARSSASRGPTWARRGTGLRRLWSGTCPRTKGLSCQVSSFSFHGAGSNLGQQPVLAGVVRGVLGAVVSMRLVPVISRAVRRCSARASAVCHIRANARGVAHQLRRARRRRPAGAQRTASARRARLGSCLARARARHLMRPPRTAAIAPRRECPSHLPARETA